MINKVSKSKLSVEEEYLVEGRSSKEEAEKETTLSDEEVTELAKDNSVLESIVKEIRENSEAALDKNYRRIFTEATSNNSKDIEFLKEEASAVKQAFVDKINSGKGFDADISKNQDYKEKYIEVFGKRSNIISFRDYNTLLEMKRVLEVEEQLAVNGLEKT